MTRFVSLLVFVLALSAVTAEGDDERNSLIVQGLNSTHELDFDSAISAFEKVIAAHPDEPIGYYFKASTYFWRYIVEDDFESAGRQFAELSQKAIDIAKARRRAAPTDEEAQLYLGRAYGNLGRYYAMEGKYLKAYFASKKAKNTLLDLTARNPDQADAYLELGLYHYYADLAPRLLRALSFILGIEGDRPLGLSQLERARQHGVYTSIDATFFLQDLYVRYEERYEEVVKLNRELVALYPANGLHLNNLALGLTKTGDAEQALILYRQIVEILEDPALRGLSRLATYQSGRALMLMNRHQEAIIAFTPLTSDPQPSEAHWSGPWARYQIGYCQELLGDRESAVSTYRQIARKANEDAYRLARERLEKPLLEIEIQSARALNCLETRKFDDAKSILGSALKRLAIDDPQYPQEYEPLIQYYLGRTHFKAQEVESAISEFEHALATDQHPFEWIRPWSHYRLALCFFELGDSDQANRHFDAAERMGSKELRLRVERDRQKPLISPGASSPLPTPSTKN